MFTNIKSNIGIGNLKIFAAPAYNRKSYISRLLSWLRYFIGAIIFTWRTSARALLFIVAEPPLLPIIGYLRNLFYGQKYVVWINDVYPDVVVRKCLFSNRSLIVRLWRRFNKLMYSRAEVVTTLGPYMKELVSQYVDGKKREKDVAIIPTWVDPTIIKPLEKIKNPFASKYRQVDKLTIMYSGNFGISHDIESIISVAEKLQKYNDVHFIMIGEGAKLQLVEEASLKLANITLLPLQIDEILPFSLSCADIAIVTLDSGFEGISMPSKTYYMMAAGAALVGISETPSDLQYVIEKYNCGINVRPGDVESFIDYILKFREKKDYALEHKKNSRLAAESVFSKMVNIEKISNMIRSAINNHYN